MKIISITLSSDTKEAIIGDALRSVIDWVDIALLVHIPGFGDDDTHNVFTRIAGSKARMISVAHDASFAEMRNVGLRYCDNAAFEGEEVWSCQLDTDERILVNSVNIRATLARLDKSIQAVTILDDTGSYDKVRFIRHPTLMRYSQSFHEELVPEPKSCSITGVRFHELPKSSEQIIERIHQQAIYADRQIDAEPNNPRWRYYLASALEKLEQHQEAIAAYIEAINLFEKNEPRAWCCFRVACCYATMGDAVRAINVAVKGMTYRPDYPELPWLIASISMSQRRPDAALEWARIAALNNWSRKRAVDITRTGFKEPLALYEGPYQIMMAAHSMLGQEADQQWAAREVKKAIKARKQFFEQGR